MFEQKWKKFLLMPTVKEHVYGLMSNWKTKIIHFIFQLFASIRKSPEYIQTNHQKLCFYVHQIFTILKFSFRRSMVYSMSNDEVLNVPKRTLNLLILHISMGDKNTLIDEFA